MSLYQQKKTQYQNMLEEFLTEEEKRAQLKKRMDYALEDVKVMEEILNEMLEKECDTLDAALDEWTVELGKELGGL